MIIECIADWIFYLHQMTAFQIGKYYSRLDFSFGFFPFLVHLKFKDHKEGTHKRIHILIIN